MLLCIKQHTKNFQKLQREKCDFSDQVHWNLFGDGSELSLFFCFHGLFPKNKLFGDLAVIYYSQFTDFDILVLTVTWSLRNGLWPLSLSLLHAVPGIAFWYWNNLCMPQYSEFISLASYIIPLHCKHYLNWSLDRRLVLPLWITHKPSLPSSNGFSYEQHKSLCTFSELL